MKSLFILAAGVLIGVLGPRMLGTIFSQPEDPAVNSVAKRNSARSIAESDTIRPEPRHRTVPMPREQVAFDARLKAALADQSMEDSSSQQRPPNDRFSAWLAGVTLTPVQKDAIRSELEARLTAGEENPLAPGSSFDLWLRNRLAADALASWTANQSAHSADKIERRANRLLVGLQRSLSLTSEQKDSIYPQLVEWAGENPHNILGSDSQDPDEQEKSFAARVEKLSALIPADQREALAEWVAEFLPTYCLEESD